MPQRAFWSQRHPCEMQWRYAINPRVPEEHPTLLVQVLDQSHEALDITSVRVPLNVVHEATSSLLVATWEAYLFGEIGDVTQTATSVIQRWRRESAARIPL